MMDFRARDSSAVLYSKSDLDQGDTLVLIRYPNDIKVYDATGFIISNLHRVHSDKLLATGSSIFKALLEDEWHQHRASKRVRRLPGLINIPSDISHVIDLTPPEEGEEALNLTADLSCSPGILNWHTAGQRCHIANTLIGGKDETTNPNAALLQALQNLETVKDNDSTEAQVSPQKSAVSSFLAGIDDDMELQQVLEKSIPNKSHNVKEPVTEDETPLDYCPIRHRTGIQRLLQAIEGKDPRLDSAPKVWTLAVLAKYFDCTQVVVDYIFRWMVAEPNCKIMEILPEAAMAIGITLQNAVITRSSFAILVSEEAFDLATKKCSPPNIIVRPDNHTKRTRFGRLRENILDENTLNAIQHAGLEFNEHIESSVEAMMEKDLDWLEDLPEYAKIKKFEAFLDAKKGGNSEYYNYTYVQRKATIKDLINSIRHYVRGRLAFTCFFGRLNFLQSKNAAEHRTDENWHSCGNFELQIPYLRMGDHERVLTRYMWEHVLNLDWTASSDNFSNLIREGIALIRDPPYQKQLDVANAMGISKITIKDLVLLRNCLNDEILVAIRDEKFNGGKIPSEAIRHEKTPETAVESLASQLQNEQISPDHKDFWSQTLFHNLDYTGGSSIRDPLRIPTDVEITMSSPFFSVPNLHHEIGSYLRKLAQSMLSRGEASFSVLCDTLLCLDDNEYKFLPLWAGGMDDGSGGVFETAIPPAEKGPAGPGPAFHTGSTMNSAASSEIDFDGQSSVFGSLTIDFQSSLAAENGFSDHIDRRLVIVKDEEMSNSDFSSISDDVDFTNGLTGHTTTLPLRTAPGVGSITTASSSTISQSSTSILNDDDFDDFLMVEGDDDLLAYDSEDDGELTETED